MKFYDREKELDGIGQLKKLTKFKGARAPGNHIFDLNGLHGIG